MQLKCSTKYEMLLSNIDYKCERYKRAEVPPGISHIFASVFLQLLSNHNLCVNGA